MASNGIRDKVAIVGMGCTPFGEHWGRTLDDLLIGAVTEFIASVPGLEKNDIDAVWLGTMGSGLSGLTLARPSKIDYKAVTRVENFCATGSEWLRNAAYAVASGAYDCVMAVGGEELKDSGHSGLVIPTPANDGTESDLTAPAMFSLLAPAYSKKYGVDADAMKDVMTHIAWKNRVNGAKNLRARFHAEVAKEAISCSPLVAGQLGFFDCSGCLTARPRALIVRTEEAHRYTDRPIFINALSFVAGPAAGPLDPDYDYYTTFTEVVRCAEDAYAQAGVKEPRTEISMAEVSDCFTPTGLVLMEDLGFAERGEGWKDVMDGFFDLDGGLPINPDGGLKSFGPRSAPAVSGCCSRCGCNCVARAERANSRIPVWETHNLGGAPGGLRVLRLHSRCRARLTRCQISRRCQRHHRQTIASPAD